MQDEKNSGPSEDPFVAWIRRIGPRKLASILGVSNSAVYSWENRSSIPSPSTMFTIVNASLGFVTYEDIIGPFYEINPEQLVVKTGGQE